MHNSFSSKLKTLSFLKPTALYFP